MSLLEVAGLGVRSADGRDLISDLSFTVDAGTRFGLIGESGSGKSLTALAIMGLLPPGMTASGSVTLDVPGRGRTEIVGAGERLLNRLRGRTTSVVFQEPLTALDPLMRIGHQVAEPLRRAQGLRGRALKTAVTAALEEVRLAEPDRIARAYPHEISGGQRQRVAIAMALACRPALLIADEPTTALDVTVQAEILALLDGLVSAHSMALLFIGHDLAVVSGITDHVLILKDGKAVESGAVLDVVNAPRHPYARELVGSARELDAALDRLGEGERS
ncbi:ABC transporter ATP-binding protein [Planotetraspora phitsanulokensis]|uniref:ABC transporter ATP-binding protein n=1 Tax=Planotetraspora phitsanulokensis TaxID=575192 RepID=A0A8J3UJM0_9ACTN|nr:ABC transporter ATP-binding protein [Planotetraspora phitsanulokensis]GII39990.1 ABC transporter ATP-binding protein [Planotetraspora phitsanulokensis]